MTPTERCPLPPVAVAPSCALERDHPGDHRPPRYYLVGTAVRADRWRHEHREVRRADAVILNSGHAAERTMGVWLAPGDEVIHLGGLGPRDSRDVAEAVRLLVDRKP